MPRMGPVPPGLSGPDVFKTQKLAQRVEETLKNQRVYQNTIQVDPREIGVAPLNRDGAPPNSLHVHQGILKSIMEKGFDPGRPQPGILVEFRSPENRQKLIEHNRRFTNGNPLLPTIDEDKVIYGSLAGSHLNIAFRLIHQGSSSPVGDLRSLVISDKNLEEAVHRGHKWIVLKEDTDPREQVEISLWRNQDQSENQGTHEIELLQTIISAAREMSASQSSSSHRGKAKTDLSELVAKAHRRTPARVSAATLNFLAKFFVQFLDEDSMHLVSELVMFHNAKVNPRDLVVSTTLFQFLVSEQGLQKAPHVRHYLLLTHYTNEKIRAQASGPSFAQFLEPQAILSLVKKAGQVQDLECLLQGIRNEYLPLLEATSSASQALLDLAALADLIIRCLLGKPWPEELKTFLGKQAIGRFSVEKVQSLKVSWATWIDQKYGDGTFAQKAGLKPLVQAEEVPVVFLDLAKLGSEAVASEEEAIEVWQFQRGDDVTTTRRMTWSLPRAGQEPWRTDVPVGTQGTVLGYPDTKHRKVLLKVLLTLEGASCPTEQTHDVYPRNIMLTEEYEQQQNAPGASSGHQADVEEPKEKRKKRGQEEWLRLDSEPEQVLVEKKWTKYLAEDGALFKTYLLRSRIGLLLECLVQQLPKFTEKDLVIAHRQSSTSGAWKCEVWTKREFKPHELLLAPVTSSVKESHSTGPASIGVTLPFQGYGAHPTQGFVSLDGRFHGAISAKDLVEPRELMGSLYWVVKRTSEQEAVNMHFETFTWQGSFTLKFPWIKSIPEPSQFLSENLPNVPLLANKKTIRAHQRLACFYETPKKVNEGKQAKKSKQSQEG